MTVQTAGEQQAQYLKEALQVVGIQSKLMRQCLVSVAGWFIAIRRVFKSKQQS